MVMRLHKKKCPKTGRTKKPEWKGRLVAERALFCRAMKKVALEVDGEMRVLGGGNDPAAKWAAEAREEIKNECDFPDCDEDCGKYGNNAAPALPAGMMCCDKCNIRKVIPARLACRA